MSRLRQSRRVNVPVGDISRSAGIGIDQTIASSIARTITAQINNERERRVNRRRSRINLKAIAPRNGCRTSAPLGWQASEMFPPQLHAPKLNMCPIPDQPYQNKAAPSGRASRSTTSPACGPACPLAEVERICQRGRDSDSQFQDLPEAHLPMPQNFEAFACLTGK